MIFDWLFNDEKNREKERMRILELRVKRLEQLQENSPYISDIRGIIWHYHHIDSDGNIIEKRR